MTSTSGAEYFMEDLVTVGSLVSSVNNSLFSIVIPYHVEKACRWNFASLFAIVIPYHVERTCE